MTPRGEDLIVGAPPLMGAKFWVGRAAEPGADRVGAEFTLAPFPRRGEGETTVMSALAVTAPRPKPSRRRAA